jgi:hypothetical protein
MVKCVLIVLAILIINDVTESKYIEGQLNSKEVCLGHGIFRHHCIAIIMSSLLSK